MAGEETGDTGCKRHFRQDPIREICSRRKSWRDRRKQEELKMAEPIRDIAGNILAEYCHVRVMSPAGDSFYVPTEKLVQYIRAHDNWDARSYVPSTVVESLRVSQEKAEEIRKNNSLKTESINYHDSHMRDSEYKVSISFVPENLNTQGDLEINPTPVP